jgi:hypothetical protein
VHVGLLFTIGKCMVKDKRSGEVIASGMEEQGFYGFQDVAITDIKDVLVRN